VKLREAPDTIGRETMWKIVSSLTGVVGALIARKIIRMAWSALSPEGEDAPVLDPADRRFTWKTAVIWSVTVGLGVSIARLVSTRVAVAGWEAATGTLPPGVEEPVEI
jgi:hypothetical protein